LTSRVGARVGVTKNLGNFESLKIEHWLEVDALPGETDKQALARVHAEVYQFTEETIAAE
jgi:hypothetical protein